MRLNSVMPNLIKFFNWPTIAGILAAALVSQYFLFEKKPDQSQTFVPPTKLEAPSFRHAVNRATPSVVNIYTRTLNKSTRKPAIFDDPFFQYFFNRSAPPIQKRMKETLGSGVIMSQDGFIITNNHVIAGADEILVLLYDGSQSKAVIIGTDPETDLAVMKINKKNLTPINIDNPNSSQVGDIVLAIGNPFGVGQTVTQGIISATGRYGLGLNTFENFIQTDAPINPGNSGGALVDIYGNLIAINTAILDNDAGWSGISFAIPADTTLQVMNDIIKYGKVIRGWLGLEAQELTPHLAKSFGLDTRQSGIIVTGIYRNSPAHKAGFKPGDVIVSINNISVADGRSGMNQVAGSRPGESVNIEVIREGQRQLLSAVLSDRPQQSN